MNRLKELGSVVFFFAIAAGLAAIVGIMYGGAAWAGRYFLPTLVNIGSWILAAILLLLLPLSIFRRFRGFTGQAIFLSSYLFGLITWLASLILTLDLWGMWAAIAGVLLLGGAVVPFALLATLFSAKWFALGFVVVGLVLTWGARIGGLMLVESKERHAYA